MENTCPKHGRTASAYCKTHRIALCTKCFIENIHKEKNCDVREIKDIEQSEEIHLRLKSCTQAISRKNEEKEGQNEALNEIGCLLQADVEIHFTKLIEKLEDKKEKTLDLLKGLINNKKVRNDYRLQNLSNLSSKVSKYKEREGQFGEEEFDQVQRNLATIKKDISNILIPIPKPADGIFIPYDESKIINESTDVLGEFEFTDERYAIPDDLVGDDRTTQYDRIGDLNIDDSASGGSDIYTNLPNTKSVVIQCPDSMASPCYFKRVYSFKEKRILVLDSAHGKLMLVDLEGKIISSFAAADDKKIYVADWCVLKKDKLAVLGFDDIGPYITQVKVSKDFFEGKSEIRLNGAFAKNDRNVNWMGFDTQTGQLAIIIVNRVLKIPLNKDKVVGYFPIDEEHIGDINSVTMAYDFRSEAVYILSKDTCSVKRYDCKTSTASLILQSSRARGQFQPLSMVIDGKEDSLTVICTENVLHISMQEGMKKNQIKRNFHPDLIAFCFCGRDIVASRDSMIAGSHVVAKSLYVYNTANFVYEKEVN